MYSDCPRNKNGPDLENRAATTKMRLLSIRRIAHITLCETQLLTVLDTLSDIPLHLLKGDACYADKHTDEHHN